MTSLAALALTVHLMVAAASPPPGAWSATRHVPGVVDVTGPRTDGALVVSGGSRLFLLDRASGALRPFAGGTGGYPGGSGDEPYLALSAGRAVTAAGCRFTPDDLFVIQQTSRDVLRIDASGRSRVFAHVAGVDSLNGITFDTVGRFGNRLLVLGPSHGSTVVVAIDCRGQVEPITDRAPIVEGGIAVAPVGFGSFGGDLVAPDELSGQIFAIEPNGNTEVVARSGLPAGQDTGVESVGFLPPGFSAGGAAYLSDRATPGNPHPGTDTLLEVDSRVLTALGVRDGDLLAATEGGALTIAVRCTVACQVREVLTGPPVAHGEGHLLAVADQPGGVSASLPEAPDLGAAARIQLGVTIAGVALGGLVIVAVVAWLVRRWLLTGRAPRR